jgi:hypothetical protein
MKDAVFRDVTQCSSFNPDVSEERVASIITVKGISELGIMLPVVTANAVPS